MLRLRGNIPAQLINIFTQIWVDVIFCHRLFSDLQQQSFQQMNTSGGPESGWITEQILQSQHIVIKFFSIVDMKKRLFGVG